MRSDWLVRYFKTIFPPPILVNETQKKMPGTIISDPVMFIARVCSNYIYTGGYVTALV